MWVAADFAAVTGAKNSDALDKDDTKHPSNMFSDKQGVTNLAKERSSENR